MSKLSALFVLSCLLALAMALPEARLQQRQQLRQQQQQKLQHPYLFFSVPRGRANAGAVVQGFEVVEDLDDVESDDDDDDADEGNSMPLRRLQHSFADDDDDDDDQMIDDDDDDVDELPVQRGFARNGQLVLLNDEDDEQDDEDDEDAQLPVLLAKPSAARKAAGVSGQQLLKNAKPTQMMVARDQAGAIMVPDGIIEIEGQSVVDEKTGKAALLVPRAALDSIPDGAVVALMERSSASDSSVGEERANRVIVRRRKIAGRRNVRRRRRGGRPVRRRAGGRRRRGNRRNVRVIRPGGNRRRGNQRRRVALQG
ncbi:PREDICTED: uncharacterized protein LOC108618565 [Drosophila arizonae]|uniref:Uncharacterized protein LOC108618565 n=1 Tax=Drosophila arizonae TaxID=7263 RepID=A0ABM1PSC4_DROAR|nr:PREDICTED: uncharacterized protein LOC108618565 [Drosophila arizonae]